MLFCGGRVDKKKYFSFDPWNNIVFSFFIFPQENKKKKNLHKIKDFLGEAIHLGDTQQQSQRKGHEWYRMWLNQGNDGCSNVLFFNKKIIILKAILCWYKMVWNLWPIIFFWIKLYFCLWFFFYSLSHPSSFYYSQDFSLKIFCSIFF